MNKKVLTLCVSALLAGGMIGTVNALPVNPTQIETKATSEENVLEMKSLPDLGEGLSQEVILNATTANSRIALAYYVGTSNAYAAANRSLYIKGAGEAKSELTETYSADVKGSYANYYWTLQSDGRLVNNAGEAFTTHDGGAQKFEIVPVKDGDKATKYFALKAGEKYVIYSQTSEKDDILTLGEKAKAAIFASVQTEYSTAYKSSELMDYTGEGFELSFAKVEGDDSEVSGTSAFAGILEPNSNDTKTVYKLKNGKKYIVFKPSTQIGDNQSADKGAFELVESEPTSGKAYGYFSIFKADNESNAVKIEVSDNHDKAATLSGRVYTAYIATLQNTNYLTADENLTNTKLPYITLGSSNYVGVENLLGKYWNISFVGDAGSDTYKDNGVLVTGEDAESATYAKANTVLLTSPETQWGVTAVSDKYTFTLTNRESGVQIENVRVRLEDGVYTIANADESNKKIKGDAVKLTSVKIEGTKHFDGFMTANETELRNKVFHIGQYHNETGNSTAFWAENHQADGLHKLGVITNEDEAVNWTLRLDKQLDKESKETAKIDTVYVITKLAGVKDGKIVNGLNPDTLAILPYQFQNKGNLEYVVLGNDGKTEYYQCQEDYSWEGAGSAPDVKTGVTPKPAQRFALKMKPNNTYNIVTLADAEYNNGKRQEGLGTEKGKSKVWVANSEQWGSIKDMAIYGEENNSLMQIIPVDRPEYRKLVSEEGSDVISIYLEENNSQVVYEKKDAKSMVEGDTLSFLNIDNVEQFTDINPAIFADTAYVNRTVDGVKNTCYQYLLAVNVEKKLDTFCPEDMSHNDPEWIAEHGVCPHAIQTPYVKARYLVNLIDTANIYGKTHLHNNPYINQSEEGAEFAKLAFVPGFHVGDSLYLVTNADTVIVDLSTPEFNIAKFAFKYDDVNAKSFKIQTLYKEYDPEAAEKDLTISQEGYLRYVNGCLVVDNGYSRGYIFNMNEDETRVPTANETIESAADGAVSVVATDGAVIVKGAEGKNVIVSTILGKVVANEVLNSDNETIAAPAGIVVVSVDGESFKVAVK